MIKDEYNLTFVFCHVNHLLRGEYAFRDQKFVEQLGKNEEITTFVLQEDINKYSEINKIGVEEAGREVRYNFFKKIMAAEHADKIALAHNFDDNVETFMFRLMRGSSIAGLSSIPVKRECFIRPIMAFKKQEIFRYLDENSIKYVNDETNDENIYTRNKIRLDLIPFIEKEFNSKFPQKISMLIEEISLLQSEINSSIAEVKVEGDEVEIESLNKLGEYSINCFLNEYLKNRGIECNRDIIINCAKIIKQTGNYKYSLGNGKELVKKYNKIFIKERECSEKVSETIQIVPGSTQNFDDYTFSSEICDTYEKNSKNTIYINYEEVKEKLEIRNRREGDYIFLKGIDGKKKIKKLFIDMKIDSDIRERIPIIAIGREVIWVAGFRVSKNYSAVEGEKVLKINYFKEE